MHYKERTMKHRFVSTVSLTIVLGVGLVSRTSASKTHNPNVLPRIIATVTTLEPRGMATITTVDGATYQVITGISWLVAPSTVVIVAMPRGSRVVTVTTVD